MENTIVPQLPSAIDGVEGLVNVIVIGASKPACVDEFSENEDLPT